MNESITENQTDSKMNANKNNINQNSLSHNKKVCNICGADFVHKSRFDRFCDDCRDSNVLYHSVEWATYS